MTRSQRPARLATDNNERNELITTEDLKRKIVELEDIENAIVALGAEYKIDSFDAKHVTVRAAFKDQTDILAEFKITDNDEVDLIMWYDKDVIEELESEWAEEVKKENMERKAYCFAPDTAWNGPPHPSSPWFSNGYSPGDVRDKR